MRFNTPEGYTTVFQGQLIQSVGGVIDTNDKALIEQLSNNPRVEAEKRNTPKAQPQKAPE